MSDDTPNEPPARDLAEGSLQGTGDAGSEPIGASSLEQTIAERLQALDHLYESKAITATELGEARRKILSGASETEIIPAAPPVLPTAEPQLPAETAAQPPAAPPPPIPPQRVDAGHVGPPEPPAEKRIAGLPVWVASLIGVLAVGVAILGGVLLLGGGGDDDANSVAAAGAAADTTYAKKIATPLRQLTNSAVVTGKSLARVSEPGELRQLNRTVERQLDVVEGARSALTRVTVVSTDQRAHRALITAAATQRRYLVALGRASSGEPTQAKLQAVNRARKAGGEAIAAYRGFFRLAPAAPDAITSTDLTDTAGLRSALNSAITTAAAPAPSRGSGSAPPRSSTYTGGSFQSPTGNLRCQLSGSDLFCSSSNDGFGVALPSYGSAITFSGTAVGGVVVPYGSTWRGGPFSCESSFDGITCSNASGNGFFLNRDTFRPF